MTLLTDLEQAQEGSRELSDKALLAAGWERQVDTASGGKLVYWRGPGSHWISEGSWLPSPTENLQDALGLVPEEWNWSVQSGSYAVVRSPDAEYDYSGNPWDGLHLVAGRDEDATAATPALALTIAALKARQEET